MAILKRAAVDAKGFAFLFPTTIILTVHVHLDNDCMSDLICWSVGQCHSVAVLPLSLSPRLQQQLRHWLGGPNHEYFMCLSLFLATYRILVMMLLVS